MGIRSEILSKGPDGVKVPILEPGILLIVILTELFSLQNNVLLDCFNIKCNIHGITAIQNITVCLMQ